MSFDVHLHVCFACDSNDGVASLAAEFLSQFPPGEAHDFLEDLSTRKGGNPGRNGGLCLWGIVGNYTNGEAFVDALWPFWTRLLTEDIEGGPWKHDHILVFEESEQSAHAIAYEIALDVQTQTLTVTKHICPFAWMQ